MEMPEQEPLADPLQAGIGQENLTVSPLQVALALAALASDGRLPTPRLVMAVQDENGVMQVQPTTTSAGDAVTSRAARDPPSCRLPRTVVAVPACSGPESRNGWYLSLTPAEQPQYAIIVVVEDSEDLEVVQAIGVGLGNRPLLPLITSP